MWHHTKHIKLVRPDDERPDTLCVQDINYEWGNYHTFISWAQGVAKRYPQLVQVDALSDLWHNNNTACQDPHCVSSLALTYRIRLQFGKCDASSQKKPLRLLLIAGVHAREHLAIQCAQGTVRCMVDRLMHQGASPEDSFSFGSNIPGCDTQCALRPRCHLDNVIIDIIPAMNVFGYFASAHDPMVRKPGKRQADIARNWPCHGVTVGSSTDPEQEDYRGKAPLCAIEANCMHDLIAEAAAQGQKYAFVLDIHSFGNIIFTVPAYDINAVLHNMSPSDPNYTALQELRKSFETDASRYRDFVDSFTYAIFKRHYEPRLDRVDYDVSGDFTSYMYEQYRSLAVGVELGFPEEVFRIGSKNKVLMREFPVKFAEWLCSAPIIQALREWEQAHSTGAQPVLH